MKIISRKALGKSPLHKNGCAAREKKTNTPKKTKQTRQKKNNSAKKNQKTKPAKKTQPRQKANKHGKKSNTCLAGERVRGTFAGGGGLAQGVDGDAVRLAGGAADEAAGHVPGVPGGPCQEVSRPRVGGNCRDGWEALNGGGPGPPTRRGGSPATSKRKGGQENFRVCGPAKGRKPGRNC